MSIGPKALTCLLKLNDLRNCLSSGLRWNSSFNIKQFIHLILQDNLLILPLIRLANRNTINIEEKNITQQIKSNTEEKYNFIYISKTFNLRPQLDLLKIRLRVSYSQ